MTRRARDQAAVAQLFRRPALYAVPPLAPAQAAPKRKKRCKHMKSEVADKALGFRKCIGCGVLGFCRGTATMGLQRRMIPYKCTDSSGCKQDATGRVRGRTSSGSLRYTCARHTVEA